MIASFSIMFSVSKLAFKKDAIVPTIRVYRLTRFCPNLMGTACSVSKQSSVLSVFLIMFITNKKFLDTRPFLRPEPHLPWQVDSRTIIYQWEISQ
jgi:hypothetical protein